MLLDAVPETTVAYWPLIVYAFGVAAVVGGMLGTFIGWRPVFGLLIAGSALVFFLSFRLKPD